MTQQVVSFDKTQWKACKLGDVLSIKHGWAFKSDFFTDNETNDPIIVGIGNFKYDGGFRFDATRIKRYTGMYPKEYELSSGDILLIMTCQTEGGEILGIPAKVPNDGKIYLHNQRLGKVEIKDKNNAYAPFLYWLFLTKDFNAALVASATGTKIVHTAPQRIENVDILLPPLSEQKEIAEILSSLDDKIDLLHRQNKTLESMAQTLFRQWFIEEANEEWGEKELGDLIETTSGGTPSRSKPEYYENGSIDWVKSKELTGSYILHTEEKITSEALKHSSAKILPKNSILIAMYGATVGEYAIIEKEMSCNQAICALKPNERYPYTFLFMYVKNYKDELINMAVGSAQQNISQQMIKKIKLPTCYNEISYFHERVEPLFEKMRLNLESIKGLNALRDDLLVRLMGGGV